MGGEPCLGEDNFVWGRRTLVLGKRTFPGEGNLCLGEENLTWGGEPCLGEENIGFKNNFMIL